MGFSHFRFGNLKIPQLLSGEVVARPSLPGSDLLVREELAIDRTGWMWP